MNLGIQRDAAMSKSARAAAWLWAAVVFALVVAWAGFVRVG
jgi:hypothetical protein